MTVFQSFLDFNELDSYEEYSSGIFVDISQFGFVYLTIWLGLQV